MERSSKLSVSMDDIVHLLIDLSDYWMDCHLICTHVCPPDNQAMILTLVTTSHHLWMSGGWIVASGFQIINSDLSVFDKPVRYQQNV